VSADFQAGNQQHSLGIFSEGGDCASGPSRPELCRTVLLHPCFFVPEVLKPSDDHFSDKPTGAEMLRPFRSQNRPLVARIGLQNQEQKLAVAQKLRALHPKNRPSVACAFPQNGRTPDGWPILQRLLVVVASK